MIGPLAFCPSLRGKFSCTREEEVMGMMNYGSFQGGNPGAYQGMDRVEPIVCPPEYCVNDTFMPREVPVIHPIVHVNRQHIVDIPRHYYTETTENVMGEQLMGNPGFGPGCGGRCGRGFNGNERFGWR